MKQNENCLDLNHDTPRVWSTILKKNLIFKMQSFFSRSNAREIFTHPLNKANEREGIVDKKKALFMPTQSTCLCWAKSWTVLKHVCILFSSSPSSQQNLSAEVTHQYFFSLNFSLKTVFMWQDHSPSHS